MGQQLAEEQRRLKWLRERRWELRALLERSSRGCVKVGARGGAWRAVGGNGGIGVMG